MSRRWARRIERCCCTTATYFPLVFVYGLTTWAVWVVVTVGSAPSKVPWLGPFSSLGGVILYLLLNWSYTTAVFTPPGSTTNDNGYSTLPTHAPPTATSFTVKANGELRFCKKCQARKPDRAHHCSTCRRCVLKMDHHCPWLATCIGLRNHKAFLLFLIYTTLFALYCFAVSGSWVWAEVLSNTTYVETLMPINYIVLAVIAGIIALVVGAFTAWHISLATRGLTTIECLEKTRYLSPLRRTLRSTYEAQHSGRGVQLPKYGQQLLDMHQNALPGITRPEEGEDSRPLSALSYAQQDDRHPTPDPDPNRDVEEGPRRYTYEELEQYRARKRHESYMDEQDSAALPNAFDLGPRRNLLHLFGPSPWLWALPICNTTGNGWTWEPSPKWVAARDRIRTEREEQHDRERAAGWGLAEDGTPLHTPTITTHYAPAPPRGPAGAAGTGGAGGMAGRPAQQQYLLPQSSPRRTPSKADRVLGRDPDLYADGDGSGGPAVSMRRLSPAGRELPRREEVGEDEDDAYESSSDEEDAAAAERRALNLVTNGAWGRGGGASGLLRKGARGGGGKGAAGGEDGGDDGVD